MKRLTTILLTGICLFAFAGCEEFLDTESYTKKNTSNFPASQDDAEQMVTGIYASINDMIPDPESVPFFVYEMAGDDRFGAGSTSNKGPQSMDRLMNAGISWFEPMWKDSYAGIFRANNAIATMDNVKSWSNQAVKNRLLAEAHFLRAYYYIGLVQLFGQVPLVLSTAPENLPKASGEESTHRLAMTWTRP